MSICIYTRVHVFVDDALAMRVESKSSCVTMTRYVAFFACAMMARADASFSGRFFELERKSHIFQLFPSEIHANLMLSWRSKERVYKRVTRADLSSFFLL